MTSNVDLCNMALANIGEGPSMETFSPPSGGPLGALCVKWLPQVRQTALQMRPWSFATKLAALSKVVVSVSSVTAATDLLTTATAHGLETNDRVTLDVVSGADPGGLTDGTTYYVIAASSLTLQLTDEEDGDAIDITSSGGTVRLLKESDRPTYAYAYAAPSDFLRALAVVPEGGDEDFPNALRPSVPACWPSWDTPMWNSVASLARDKVELNKAGELVVYTRHENASLRYVSANVTDPNDWPPAFQNYVAWLLSVWLAGHAQKDARTVMRMQQMADYWLSLASGMDANQHNVPLPDVHPYHR